MTPDSTSSLDVPLGGASASLRPIRAKLLELLVSPGEVFAETVREPSRPANWVVPTFLIGLAALVIDAGSEGAHQSEKTIRLLAIGLGPAIGTLWCAFVLWFMGRVFLKRRFLFLKALEVAGLAGTVTLLGAIVTQLLVLACDDPAARPALSIFVPADAPSRLRTTVDALNVFHLWGCCVLSSGLSRLSAVSLKEAAFWVFGYWFLLRLALVWLASPMVAA